MPWRNKRSCSKITWLAWTGSRWMSTMRSWSWHAWAINSTGKRWRMRQWLRISAGKELKSRRGTIILKHWRARCRHVRKWRTSIRCCNSSKWRSTSWWWSRTKRYRMPEIRLTKTNLLASMRTCNAKLTGTRRMFRIQKPCNRKWRAKGWG